MINKASLWLATDDALEGDELIEDGFGVKAETSPSPDTKLVVDGKFNPDSMTLMLVREDGSEVPIDGFVFPNYIEGPRGRKGKKGKAGKDGRDGRDGGIGCEGCEGPKGEAGSTGATGATGYEGEVGATGPTGPPGKAGAVGATGAIGNTGMLGAVGERGAGCLTGPIGPMGLSPVETVVVQSNQPNAINVHIWGIPDVNYYAVENQDVEREDKVVEFTLTPIDMIIKSPSNDSSDGTFFTGTGVSNIIHFEGGVGPFNYEWTGDFETDDAVTFSVGQRGRTLMLNASANVQPSESKTLTGKIQLAITDEGHKDRPVYTAETSYNINFINPSDDQIWDERVWQPRSGSIVFGNRMTLTNGQNIRVEQLYENETAIGLEIDGLPEDWKNWSTPQLSDSNSRNKGTQIVEIVKGQAKSYIQLNEMKVLPDKYVLVQRGNWQWMKASEIVFADKLYRKGGQAIGLHTLEHVDEEVFTVAIDTEVVDTFFLEGYLVHD